MIHMSYLYEFQIILVKWIGLNYDSSNNNNNNNNNSSNNNKSNNSVYWNLCTQFSDKSKETEKIVIIQYNTDKNKKK